MHTIRSFRHAGLEKFYRTDSKAGIRPAHAVKLRGQLTLLGAIAAPQEMDVPGWHLHALNRLWCKSNCEGNRPSGAEAQLILRHLRHD